MNLKSICKAKGFKLSISEKGFTSEGFKYRIQEYDDDRTLMYAFNVKEVLFLIGAKLAYDKSMEAYLNYIDKRMVA